MSFFKVFLLCVSLSVMASKFEDKEVKNEKLRPESFLAYQKALLFKCDDLPYDDEEMASQIYKLYNENISLFNLVSNFPYWSFRFVYSNSFVDYMFKIWKNIWKIEEKNRAKSVDEAFVMLKKGELERALQILRNFENSINAKAKDWIQKAEKLNKVWVCFKNKYSSRESSLN